MFNQLWHDITHRENLVTVQNREELEHVFNLIEGCESYLEVGTAEGNSLYVLSHALKPNAPITYIDWGEPHTKGPREEMLAKISNPITAIIGDSNDYATYHQVANQSFDVVLIDAGHDDFNVAIDAMFYGQLAKKYIIFHDVKLKDVERVYEWFKKQMPDKRSYLVINSDTYGYGVIVL